MKKKEKKEEQEKQEAAQLQLKQQLQQAKGKPVEIKKPVVVEDEIDIFDVVVSSLTRDS
jgi:hypothetical protein